MRFCAVVLLSVLLASPSRADAAERKPRVQSAYLVGLDIHTPRGGVVHVALPERRATDTTLYGKTAEGWLVRVRCGVFLVRGAELRRLPRTRTCGYQSDYTVMLDDDRREFLQIEDQQGAAITIESVDMAGKRGPFVYVDAGFDLRDAAAGKAYVETYHELVEADLATGETRVLDGRRPEVVDAENDTVFLPRRGAELLYGPTRLSDPGRLDWVQRFRATDVSPDGTYVIGDALTPSGELGRLQVRRMVDGELVRALPRPGRGYDYYDDIGFDTDLSVVMVDTVGNRRVLVRCELPRGRCARVTRLTRLALSLPTAVVGPDRSPP